MDIEKTVEQVQQAISSCVENVVGNTNNSQYTSGVKDVEMSFCIGSALVDVNVHLPGLSKSIGDIPYDLETLLLPQPKYLTEKYTTYHIELKKDIIIVNVTVNKGKAIEENKYDIYEYLDNDILSDHMCRIFTPFVSLWNISKLEVNSTIRFAPVETVILDINICKES